MLAKYVVLWHRTPKGFLMKHGLFFWVLAQLNYYYYSFPYFIEICTHSYIKGSLVCRFSVVWSCPQSTSVVVNAEYKVRSSETHWDQGLIANLTELLPFVFWIEVWGTIGIAFVCCILWIVCSLAIPWNQYHWTCNDSTIAILSELVILWVFWRRRLLRLRHLEPAHCWRQASLLLGCFVLVVVCVGVIHCTCVLFTYPDHVYQRLNRLGVASLLFPPSPPQLYVEPAPSHPSLPRDLHPFWAGLRLVDSFEKPW